MHHVTGAATLSGMSRRVSKTDGESLAGLTGFFRTAACFSVAAVCERIIQEDVTRSACVGEQVAKKINTDDANDSRQ